MYINEDVAMSLENKVKLLERVAKISDKLTRLSLSLAVLLLVYYVVLGQWYDTSMETNAVLCDAWSLFFKKLKKK